MPRRLLRWAVTTAALAAMSAFVGAQGPTQEAADKAYVPLRTPWGDPDLQGAYTNSDESQTPMERPKELESRQLGDITPQELARLNEQRNQARAKADEARWELRSPLHWFENLDFRNSRAWMVTDPPDGRIPPLTPEARARAAARTAAAPWPRRGRFVRGPQPVRSLHQPRPAWVDDARHLRQLVRHHAGARRGGHSIRDDSRDARHPARRRAARRRGHPLVHGRRARPVRRRHARRGDHQHRTNGSPTAAPADG